jgi:MFS family permease
MVAANIGSAIGQGGTAALLLTGRVHVWQIAALAALTGTASAFFAPASQAALQQTVARHQLRDAVVMSRLTWHVTQMAGPVLAGALIVVIGPAWLIAWDAATFAIAAIILLRLRLPPVARDVDAFRTALQQGWHEFWSRRWLRSVVLNYAIVTCAWAGGFQLLGPVVAQRDLGGAAPWGLLVGALSTGCLAGGVVYRSWGPSRALLGPCLSTLTMALPLIGLAVHLPLVVLVALTFLAGMGMELFGAAWSTTLQQRIPAETFSRVVSYDALSTYLSFPLGYAAAAPLSMLIGDANVLFVAAALVVLPTLLMLLLPDVRLLKSDYVRKAVGHPHR